MAEHVVVDKNGTPWDVQSSKSAADTSRKALDKRQPQFKPFTVEPPKETS